MNGNCSDSQPSIFNLTGSSRAGLIRRDFLRSLGVAAASVGLGLLPRSLTGRTVDTAPVAAPLLGDRREERSVLGLDSDDAQKARRYESDIATFQPWVGKNYEAAPFQTRTLILGEADYEWKGGEISECRNATRDLVTDLIAEPSDDGRLRHSSWIYLAMLFTNKWLYSLDERRRFWDGVAFYNYLQSPAGFGPDGVSTPTQWKESEAPFLDVLRLLKPQFMAVLGERLWNNLPLDRQVWNRDGLPLFFYHYPGGSCLAVPVRECCSRVHRK